MNLKTLVLAGGSGTRLWPLSRKYYPKQFIKLNELDGYSLFQLTLLRAKNISGVNNILVLTNSDYKFHCINQASEIGITLNLEQLVIEPMSKNTLGAICLGIDQIDADDICLVLPSDHVIGDENEFNKIISFALNKSLESIIVFGVKPIFPNTGYGYISFENATDFPHKVKEFKEKPTLNLASQYLNNGYYWNAGIFMFTKNIFLRELNKSNSEYYSIIKNNIKESFDRLPDLSIDYGLLEKSDNIFMMPLNIYWNDLGSFDAIDDHFSNGVSLENVVSIESNNNLMISEINNKVVGMIGVDDLIVIDTKDALLISKKGETQKIKDIVAIIKDKFPKLSETGLTVYRPWGSYTIIDEGKGYKTKRISVLCGKKLSSQMHYHRSEHWVVVDGTAIVTIGDNQQVLRKGESVFIPAGIKHRLENPGKTDLHIIESQIGDYLEEDDIVRFEDDFDRK